MNTVNESNNAGEFDRVTCETLDSAYFSKEKIQSIKTENNCIKLSNGISCFDWPHIAAPSTNKLNQLVDELLSSEALYLKDLLVVFKAFYLPFKQCHLFTLRDIEEIFNNWLELIECSEKFIQDITEAIKYNSFALDLSNLPAGLVNIVSHLTQCAEFSAKSNLSIRRYNMLLSKNVAIRQFEQACLKKIGSVPALGLGAYIIKPMQRLTKLKLLFDQLLSEYNQIFFPRAALTAAVKHVGRLCREADEGVKKTEYEFLSSWLERKIVHTHDPELCINGFTKNGEKRRLLHHGVLKLLNKNKDVLCFLFSDIIIICLCPIETLNHNLLFLECQDNCMVPYKSVLSLTSLSISK